MTILRTLRGTAKCPKCGGTSEPTTWLPPSGYDGMLRRFSCQSCQTEFYYVIPTTEALDGVKVRVRALRELEEILDSK